MPPGWMLYQDKDPKHKSNLKMGTVGTLQNGTRARIPGWFAASRAKLINPPPYPPDINVIEHRWSFVKESRKEIQFEGCLMGSHSTSLDHHRPKSFEESRGFRAESTQ